MISHYLKVALRLIKRSFLFSTINMLGFVLGMAAAFLIYLWVVDELTFEDYNPDAGRIFRVIEANCTESGEIVESPFTAIPLAEAFRKEFPQVEQATYVKARELRSLCLKDRNLSADMICVDTTFFDMFPFKVAEGDPSKLKSGFNHIVLSEKMARKFFGTASAIGQQLIYTGGMDTEYSLTVVGVVKVPRKSHLQFDAVVGQALFDKMNENVCIYRSGTDWDRREANVYVKMRSGSSMSDADRNQMSRLLSNRVHAERLLRFQPLNDIHLKTDFVDVSVRNHGNMTSIFLFIALAVLIVFMGAFNFTTLSTARAALRYKEIGVRKVTGAKRKTLIVQFLSESLVQAFISLVLALALTELLLPLFNQMMGKDITLQFSWSVLAYIVVGIVGVGCLSGSYPAFYLSAINPLMAFKGGQKSGKKGGLIRGLLCVQFVIAITLLLYTGIVFKQLNYLQNKDLGLNRENIVSVYTSLWYNVDGFRQEILKNPNILSVSMGAEIADYMEDSKGQGDVLQWTDAEGKVDSLRMMCIWADGNFVNTFGLKLLKGEILKADAGAYFSGAYDFPIIINETAWKAMNVSDPVGMEISGGFGVGSFKKRIVGVVQDFNFQSLREKIKPAYLMYSPECLVNIHIKISPEHKQETLAFIQKKFEEMAPLFVKEFKYQFFSDALNRNYEKERQQGRMLFSFTVLAIVIAMMGVFGLVSLSTRQRTKEIGIRKVNGAHSDRIVKMFCLEYLKWVGIAFVIACPSGYLLMYYWLSDFAYQTAISWWLFPLVGLIIASITLLTVIGQTWRTASQNPVKSLRYE